MCIMVNEDHISINGPWSPDHPNLVTAVDLQWQLASRQALATNITTAKERSTVCVL